MLLPALALGEATPALPMDFTPGHVADPANYTENGYEDETLSVTMERVWVGDAQFNVARVKIADPSQLRIGLAAPFGTKKTNRVSTIARDNNAVVAIGGDYFANEEGGYVVRMGEAYRKKPGYAGHRQQGEFPHPEKLRRHAAPGAHGGGGPHR